MKNKNQFTKQYTFMKLNRSTSKSGEDYVSCTLAGQIISPTALATAPDSGRSVISFVTPIKNRSQTIKRFCGAEPSIDESGTTWADVTVWGRRAENFAKYLQRHPRSVITIVGSMRVEEVLNKQGEPYNRVKITMTDFDHKVDIPVHDADDLDTDAENEDTPADAGPDDTPAAIHEDAPTAADADEGRIPPPEDPFLPDAA